MKTSGHTLPPLLIEWSPTRVRVFDSTTGQTRVGASIAECFTDGPARRDAVIAVGPRSTFIRTVSVPSVSRDEIEKMVGLKLGPLLPLARNEYVAGFRVGKEPKGDGRVAVVGAVKTGSLRRIHEEAEAAGLRVRAVLPLAFGSWMAARSRSLNDCAVVQIREATLNVDVVSGGELRYSRSVPIPDSIEEVKEEIAKTLAIAEAPPMPILAAAAPEITADYLDSRDPIEYLGDPQEVRRLLFSLELPEKAKARQSRREGMAAQRALVAAILAVGLGAYGYVRQARAEASADSEKGIEQSQLKHARDAQKLAQARGDKLHATHVTLDRAFKPAQSPSDMLVALGAPAPKNVWLTGVTVERGKPFLIRGQATQGGAITKFVADLGQDKRFRNVKLVYATQAMIGKTSVFQFSISGRAVGNLPIESTSATSEEKR